MQVLCMDLIYNNPTKQLLSPPNVKAILLYIYIYTGTEPGFEPGGGQVTFGTSVWRFSETRTSTDSTLGVGNLASSAMTSELFGFFLLKKFNIVVDLHMIYKLKKKKKVSHYFHNS